MKLRLSGRSWTSSKQKVYSDILAYYRSLFRSEGIDDDDARQTVLGSIYSCVVEEDNLMFSVDLKDPKLVHGEELFQFTIKLVELSAKPNMTDFFPFLLWLDPQGIRRKVEQALGGALEIAAGYVKDRVQRTELGAGEEGQQEGFPGCVIGIPRKVEENDIGQLQYLEAVVKEFLGSSIESLGHHFQFLPFGAGRRICPGLPLANWVLHLLLATLLQSFNWAREEGVTPETLDMSEKSGTTLRKVVPLKAKATPRPPLLQAA
ncbi:geraniol 8-hydroxylase-like [Macadamia integrifolia]|uniref:geraniol 8-hydroxylase-like n=1 Tax=Macadamia integrifolia TaxID=60698 RepID=UPI001C4F9316|nr:geraniol 8-hydroxylase-like [Macadamia integrifolia]